MDPRNDLVVVWALAVLVVFMVVMAFVAGGDPAFPHNL